MFQVTKLCLKEASTTVYQVGEPYKDGEVSVFTVSLHCYNRYEPCVIFVTVKQVILCKFPEELSLPLQRGASGTFAATTFVLADSEWSLRGASGTSASVSGIRISTKRT